MEELNTNSILYYASICDCLNTFFRIDKEDKRFLSSIKKKIIKNDYVNNYYCYNFDFKKLLTIKRKYTKYLDIFSLIEDLEEYFNMINIISQIC